MCTKSEAFYVLSVLSNAAASREQLRDSCGNLSGRTMQFLFFVLSLIYYILESFLPGDLAADQNAPIC